MFRVGRLTSDVSRIESESDEDADRISRRMSGGRGESLYGWRGWGEDEGGGTNSSTVVVEASECGEVGRWGLLMRRWCTKVVVSGNFCEAFQCVCVRLGGCVRVP